MQDRLEGRNPVMEALRAGREIDKIFIKKGEIDGSLIPLVKLAKRSGIVVSEVERQKLDQMSETGAHQGVVALCAMHEYVGVDDILARAAAKGEAPFLVILDKVSDPHNLGSVLRTANGAGVHGVIIPKHGAVGLSATVAKASAGAIEFTPVAKVTNLAAEIERLKKLGVWVYGADGAAKQSVYQTDFSGPAALVLGSEGEGISRLVREKCDVLVNIPMRGEINSLNVSVAAAIFMYEAAKNRL